MWSKRIILLVFILFFVMLSAFCDIDTLLGAVGGSVFVVILLGLLSGKCTVGSSKTRGHNTTSTRCCESKNSSQSPLGWRRDKEYIPTAGVYRDNNGNYYSSKGTPVVTPVNIKDNK